MTWVEEIEQALRALNGVAPYAEIYSQIEKTTHRQLTPAWQATIRRTIEDHSSHSMNYRGEDLFYSVNGLGKGTWGLRSMVVPTPVAPDSDEPDTPIVEVILSRIIRDTALCRILKQLYGNHCQVCKKVIKLPKQNYSEGHHLKPLGRPHNGPDIAGNILILCPDHHAEFDFGAIGVDPDTLRIIHIDPSNPSTNTSLQIHSSHGLERRFLQYHLAYIYNRAPALR